MFVCGRACVRAREGGNVQHTHTETETETETQTQTHTHTQACVCVCVSVCLSLSACVHTHLGLVSLKATIGRRARAGSERVVGQR